MCGVCVVRMMKGSVHVMRGGVCFFLFFLSPLPLSLPSLPLSLSPSPLLPSLTRFDLIFLMLDPQDEQFDRRLATHLVSLYHQSLMEKEESFMDMADLRDYIAFGRSYIHPQLSEEAGQALIHAYVGKEVDLTPS